MKSENLIILRSQKLKDFEALDVRN